MKSEVRSPASHQSRLLSARGSPGLSLVLENRAKQQSANLEAALICEYKSGISISSMTSHGIGTLSTLMQFASNSLLSDTNLTTWDHLLSLFSSIFLSNVLCLSLSLRLLQQCVAELGSLSLT